MKTIRWSFGLLILTAFWSTARGGDAGATSPGPTGPSERDLEQIVASSPGQIVQPLPGQRAQSLPGEVVQSLPGQIVPALPGQITGPLPGQMAAPLPGQLTPPLPGEMMGSFAHRVLRSGPGQPSTMFTHRATTVLVPAISPQRSK